MGLQAKKDDENWEKQSSIDGQVLYGEICHWIELDYLSYLNEHYL